jgi:hypothetical protein
MLYDWSGELTRLINDHESTAALVSLGTERVLTNWSLAKKAGDWHRLLPEIFL